MNEPKVVRWGIVRCVMTEIPKGPHVLYSDYAKLEYRVEELEGDKTLEFWEYGTLARCKAENERLREIALGMVEDLETEGIDMDDTREALKEKP